MLKINWNPDRRVLRVFGVAALVVFGVLGTWVRLRHCLSGIEISQASSVLVACVLWGVGGACGLLAAARPNTLKPLYLGLSIIVFPVGVIISLLVLALVYYGIVTPIGVAMRLAGHDPLHRRFDPQAGSYWTRRSVAGSVKRYFRQF